MTKILVYIMDKIVWTLLIMAVTTQSLQIAGVVDSPQSFLGEIEYPQDREYNFQVSVGDSDVRGKRQTEERSPFIDSLFNIPISTLHAVNNLVQSSRPAFRSLKDFAVKRFSKSNNKDKSDANNTSENQTTRSLERLFPVFIRKEEKNSN